MPSILMAGPQRSQNFGDPYLRRYGLTYSDRIGNGTREEGHVLEGQARPYSKRRGPSAIIFETYIRPHGMTHSNQICMVMRG